MDRIDQAVTLFITGEEIEALDLVRQVLEDRAQIESGMQYHLDLRNQGNYGAAISEIDTKIQRAGGGSLLGRLLHDRGTTLQGAKRFNEALNCLRAAYLLRRAAGDAVGASYSAFQIPMCRLVAKDPPEALKEEFRNAGGILGQILREEGNTLEVSHEGNLRQNIAFCLQFVGAYKDALAQYTAVLPLRQQAEDNRGYAMTQSRIAECLVELGLLDEAEKAAQSALSFFEGIGDQNRIQQVRATLERIGEEKERR